ncbi:probable glycosyltransferase At5g25310 [Macadamia integrifolia]|uniref:probable glycosyltransferase At5g25310 n=1 Tax=Macadamia integrifolia TaxID=60698 RepID=UPI001C4F1A27|nr:probable glycosyltransferase At5g25310 [Macadamia integrifolia]
MEPPRVISVIFLSSVFFLSLIIVSIVWGDLNPFLGFSFTKLKDQSHNKFELQTTLAISKEAQSVISTTSTGSSLNRFKSPAVIRRVGNDRTGDKLEEGLARARAAIRQAALSRNVSYGVEDDHDTPAGDIYRNPGAFYQSYMEMEKSLRVFVYEEGEPPFVHDGPCKDLYTVEGRFIQEMEFGNHLFRTSDPHCAHVYFMPYSVTMMVSYLYKPYTYDVTPLQQFVSGYLKVISKKYPFWNRTLGADHFMLACHDWGPDASRGNPYLYNTSIRVLCNANTSEGFNPRKDVSLPEIYLYDGNISPELLSVPPEDAPRPYIAFFSGGVHGPIRPLLLQHWKERDNDLRVFEYLPKDLNYNTFMLQSKFCLCPSGYEVASPRIVEAIYAECVPVILSENYVLPFSDVLRWEAFSVQVNVSDIPNLKKILSEIPEEDYRRLKMGVKAVRKHFVLNKPVKRYDAFHMILHSIWLRRLNVRLNRQ